MKNKKYFEPSFFAIAFSLFLLSCNQLIFRDVECREPNNESHLSWFPGELNDTITFIKPNGSAQPFIIDNKSIFHTTQYTSDTGCSCHDLWGMRMISGSDTISMYNQEKYVEDNEATSSHEAYVTIDGATTVFLTEDKSLIDSLTINSNSITNVLRYSFENNLEGQFKEIYIAQNMGIVQMIAVNGDIWTNENLPTILDVSFESFIYEENTCK